MKVVTSSLIYMSTFSACLHGYRATPYLPFTCPFPDHHLWMHLTERVGVPTLAIVLAFVLYLILAWHCVILRGPKTSL